MRISATSGPPSDSCKETAKPARTVPTFLAERILAFCCAPNTPLRRTDLDSLSWNGTRRSRIHTEAVALTERKYSAVRRQARVAWAPSWKQEREREQSEESCLGVFRRA